MNVVHLIDNLEWMRTQPDKRFPLAIVDPQTGQNEGKKHISRNAGVVQKNGNILKTNTNHRISDWDSAPPTQEYWNELFRISQYQIIMCENRLDFEQKKTSAGRIVWNLLRTNDFSACQIMWTNLFQRIDYFEYMWNGMLQGIDINVRKQIGNKRQNQKRIHPSEKPIKVYEHLLDRYAKPDWDIVDTHAGSGSLRIACHNKRFNFEGTEKDPGIWQDQEDRYQSIINPLAA